MKRIIILTSILASSLSAGENLPLSGKTILVPRSPSTNAALNLIADHHYKYLHNTNQIYGNLALIPSYAHSFRAHHLAQYFFGMSEIEVTGSLIPAREKNDLLADYFGLSPNFASTILVKPWMEYVVTTADWFIGYKNWYFRAIMPFGWTQWDFKLDENVENTGINTPYPAGYMSLTSLTAPATSFNQALQGTTFGQVTIPLRYGKVVCPQSVTGISSVLLQGGWLAVNRDNGHAGFNLRLAAPTANKPDPEYLFTPLINNGHNWEVGVGFSGAGIVWEKDGEQTLQIFVDFNVMHLCASEQKRSFDLYAKSLPCESQNVLSRYMLIKEFDQEGNYTGNLQPLINITTLCCKVRADAQIDFAAMLSYVHKAHNFDIGYNLWVKTRERITCRQSIARDRYALKGIQNVYSFTPTELSNATESTATIHGAYLEEQEYLTDNPSPKFIQDCDIDQHSAETSSQMTHKFFAHVAHTWNYDNRIQPHIGVGGEVEFEGDRPDDLPANKNTRSLWSLHLLAGVSY